MNRPFAFRSTLIGCALLAAAGSFAASSFAASSDGGVARASDWLGSLVLAPNGEEIGTIRDLAVDPASGKIVYIVVSVGSFLIEDNLIAVRPDALTQTGDHQWVLYTDVDSLRRAQRFATDKPWPARADVARSANAEAAQPNVARTPELTQPPSEPETAESGTATISTNTRTAYLSGGERYIKEVEPSLRARASQPPAPPAMGSASNLPPIEVVGDSGRFDRLDKDRDGVLNRSEIALQMGPKDKFSKVDVNANGVVERDEFEILQAQHAQNE
jgi:hypothetical protein